MDRYQTIDLIAGLGLAIYAMSRVIRPRRGDARFQRPVLLMLIGGILTLLALALGFSLGRYVGFLVAFAGGVLDHQRHDGPSVLDSIRGRRGND